ncbi:MAG: glycine--tRNA ligase subunit beta [Francisellaceae bacterium]|jgi:glycyl-tRNA synthetase beta chain|nr:glycine--tRNA ligase subunit beta [Francisellaceae bacterium]
MQDNLLIEIGTEELPPKQLISLATNLLNGFSAYIENAGFNFTNKQFFASPRRLAIYLEKVEFEQETKMVEILGPMLVHAFDEQNNPKPAAIGFAKKFNTSIAALEVIDSPKGQRLAFKQAVSGKCLRDAIEPALAHAIKQLPQHRWMHWEDKKWMFVRPVHWLLALYGKEVLPCKLFDSQSSNISHGHRFYAPQALTINSADEYITTLRQAKVVACPQERKDNILKQIKLQSQRHSVQAVIDDDLLNEICAIVEWPRIMIAEFNASFLSVPKEVLTTSMQEHQKCIATINDDGKLSNKFIIVSNMDPQDTKNIIEGNQRVMNARLSDAAFYFSKDKKTPLEDMAKRLANVVFFEKLGTLHDKTLRITQLSKIIGKHTKADLDVIESAAKILKADLMSEMVGEFPELQGTMGKYYAQLQGRDPAVAKAIEEHYLPKFSKDNLATSSAGIALALADRLDSLAGFFSLGLQPQKDKDPYGLRRQALAIVRILVEKDISIEISSIFSSALTLYKQPPNTDVIQEFVLFTFERAKSWYLQQGYTARQIDAAANTGIDNISDLNSRLLAIKHFTQSDNAASLSEANKRVRNILSKNNIPLSHDYIIQESLLVDAPEKDLLASIYAATEKISPMLIKRNYIGIIDVLSALKKDVDAFFEHVMVMCDDEKIRQNRLAILVALRKLFLTVGDVSLL